MNRPSSLHRPNALARGWTALTRGLALPRSLALLLAIALLLGATVRTTGLDRKVYWGDEVFTSYRVAGYTLETVLAELFDGQPRTAAALQRYQAPQPDSRAADTVRALAVEDPQHPPLYYLPARWWEQLWGSTLATRRAWAALCGLAAIPAIFLWVAEWRDRYTAAIAAALAALSPFYALYAQEVRQYGLWTAAIALCGWLLLRSLRRQTAGSWAAYALSLAVLLYAHLFSLLVAAAFGLYGLARSWQPAPGDAGHGSVAGRQRLARFGLATAAGGAAFLPWLAIAAQNAGVVERTNQFTAAPVPFPSLLYAWGLNLVRLWLDWDPAGQLVPLGGLPGAVARGGAIAAVGLLVAVSFYWLCTRTDRATWLLPLLLAGVQGTVLVGLDLGSGGFRSAVARYLFPTYLGLQLAIAAFLAARLQARWGRAVLAALLAAGAISCAIAAPAETWWTKQGSFYNGAAARAIVAAATPAELAMADVGPGDRWGARAIVENLPQASDSPLERLRERAGTSGGAEILANAYVPRTFSLSYELPPETRFRFLPEAAVPNWLPSILAAAEADGRVLFLYRPSASLLAYLEGTGQYAIDRIYRSPPIREELAPVSDHADLWVDRLTRK